MAEKPYTTSMASGNTQALLPTKQPESKVKSIYYNTDGSVQERDNRKPARVFDENGDQRPAYKNYNNGNGGYRHNNTRYIRGGGNGYRGNSGRPPRRDIYVPRSEFDIQFSNAKFDKEKLAEEIIPEIQSLTINENLQTIHTATFYDKNQSFFDNISCETKLADKEPKDHDYK